ncbi:unnamed protein product, partial [Arabidopsis halleri]
CTAARWSSVPVWCLRFSLFEDGFGSDLRLRWFWFWDLLVHRISR